jgi:hypothetical protein
MSRIQPILPSLILFPEIFGEEYKLRSSTLFNLLYPHVTSSLRLPHFVFFFSLGREIKFRNHGKEAGIIALLF